MDAAIAVGSLQGEGLSHIFVSSHNGGDKGSLALGDQVSGITQALVWHQGAHGAKSLHIMCLGLAMWVITSEQNRGKEGAVCMVARGVS